jgi:menaquinone-dependent protoporphyrinogen IX oxidase
MVTPGYYPIKGETETVVRNLAIMLNENGGHTDVMTFNMNRKWKPKWKGKIEIIARA